MDVHVQRADHEVVEHGPVLRDPGAIPRVVADGGRSASGEHRGPGSAQPQAFCGRGSRGGRAQPRQLGTQLRGLDARWRLDLDLIAGELSGDQLSQIRCGPRDDAGGGWLRGPAVWVDKEVLLLDADRGSRPGHDSTASRKARSASSPCTANTTRSRDRESCPRTASTISRAASSSGKPPTPVPNATRASDRQPRSSALDRVDRVAWVMIPADVGPPSSIVAAWMTYCAGMSPAVVSTASPRPIGAFSSDSRCTAGPPAREIAAATPPPCLSRVLAALAIASTSSLVTSACSTSTAIIDVSSRRRRHHRRKLQWPKPTSGRRLPIWPTEPGGAAG